MSPKRGLWNPYSIPSDWNIDDRLNIKTLELQDVSFSYDNFASLIIKNIKLNINSGDRVGIIGETGSGKSTLLDLMLGLISPSSGKIILNGELDLSKNIRLWHQEIGYVPQKIYLDDKTIIQNIAYGIEDHKINYEKAVECCEIAQAESMTNQAPVNYWIHANMLTLNGQKMAKSTGNNILPDEMFSGKNEIFNKVCEVG